MQGKSVLITGGAKRVGAAICRRMHAAGANLVLHYRASAGEARLLQAEHRYAVQGWYLDGFIHYTWGWFEDTPAGFDGRSFDGVMFGVNFVK